MKCETCNTEFTPMENFEDYNQAAGCAASLYYHDGSYFILAHYGSRYDMNRYLLNKDEYKEGDICDSCIESYISSGKARLWESGVW